MKLAEERLPGYLGALARGLDALAPSVDWVDASRARQHLMALHPGVSGRLLLPALVDDDIGLPDFAWMDRARAFQGLARRDPASHSAQELALARRRDPALAARLEARERLQDHLQKHVLMPAWRVGVQPRRRGETEDFTLVVDATVPARGWMRLRLDVRGAPGWHDPSVLRLRDGGAEPGEGLVRLLSRHRLTGLDALRLQLRRVLGVEVPRLSRSWLGPFWFPGLPGALQAPPPLRERLSLHATLEVLSTEVRRSGCRDPLATPRPTAPEGYGRWRERRIAATGELQSVHSWWSTHGPPGVLVPISGR